MCKIPTSLRHVTKVLHGYPKKHEITLEWITIELWNRFGIKLAESTLERYFLPNDDLKLPADLVGPICEICNNDYSVLDIIKTNSEKIEINCKSIVKLTKEATEAICTLSGSIEDGKLNHNEKQDCIKELLDLKQFVSKLLAQLVE